MQGFESQYSWHELPRELVPDGIFISSKGERIAFEIETTPRKKSRYEDKRDGFLSVMRGRSRSFTGSSGLGSRTGYSRTSVRSPVTQNILPSSPIAISFQSSGLEGYRRGSRHERAPGHSV